MCGVVEGVRDNLLLFSRRGVSTGWGWGVEGWIKRRCWRAHFCTLTMHRRIPSVTHAHAHTRACVHARRRLAVCVRAFAGVHVNDMCQSATAARLCREQGLRAVVPPYGGIISISRPWC